MTTRTEGFRPINEIVAELMKKIEPTEGDIDDAVFAQQVELPDSDFDEEIPF